MSLPRTDLTGQQFGKWTVLEYSHSDSYHNQYWLCRCECGTERKVICTRSGRSKSKSCGCAQRKAADEHWNQYIGQRFGRLTVIGTVFKKNHNAYLECICDCGEQVRVRGAHIQDGATKSCGCYRSQEAGIQRRIAEGEAAFNGLYTGYRLRAKKKGWEFALDKEEFRSLTRRDCYYCGCEPAQTRDATWSSYSYNGIDRLDSKRGYIVGNVVPCCGICNTAKMDLSHDDFLEKVRQIYEHHFREEL